MRLIFLSFILLSMLQLQDALAQTQKQWKAGVARQIITPQKNIWMAGYGNRDHVAEAKLHDLWAKAIALEDAAGQRAVMISSDLLGMPKDLSEDIKKRLQTELKLSKAQIMINSSHTHTGPVLSNSLSDIYPLNEQQKKDIATYSELMVSLMVQLVKDAFQDLEPADLYVENGISRFQVNRRNNDESSLKATTSLNGPNDYAVPVIKVERPGGNIKAILFGYACHPTVLSFYQWSGDYPGFAQLALEEMYPGATALFFQGAGADQNPLPRRSVSLAKQYGQTLVASVEQVLSEEMRPLKSQLSTAYSEIDLKLTTPPSKDQLSKMIAETDSYQKRWAERMLSAVESGKPRMKTYPYPLQLWQLGDQPIFALGGELVVDYSLQLKRIFGDEIFVFGYSNDVMAYIPSARILREGGYEGASSQIVYGLPSSWSSEIENHIIAEMLNLAKEVGLSRSGRSLLEK